MFILRRCCYPHEAPHQNVISVSTCCFFCHCMSALAIMESSPPPQVLLNIYPLLLEGRTHSNQTVILSLVSSATTALKLHHHTADTMTWHCFLNYINLFSPSSEDLTPSCLPKSLAVLFLTLTTTACWFFHTSSIVLKLLVAKHHTAFSHWDELLNRADV